MIKSMIQKVIHSQDSFYKLNYKKSGETSLNLSNEIKDLIAPELSRGQQKKISFKVYREDFVKAACYIIGHLPLYKSSSKDCQLIEYNESILTLRLNSINSLFGQDDTAIYTVNLLYRNDGRIYLNELKDKGFNARDFLVEENSILTFEKKEGVFVLRLLTGPVNEGSSDSTNNSFTFSSSTDLPSVIQSYLTAIRTKPFLLLAGISGTGKSRIVRKLAQATMTEELHKAYNPNYVGDFEKDRWTMHAPENFQIIQVKPNWHNSMDVVGFKSNIGKESHYEFTPFVEFIAKAWHHTDIPFFLCLDEMNLAPVEEYFAEFLSAIESRSKNEDGQYETDPIVKPFDDFGMEVCGQMIGHLVNSDMDEGLRLENQFRKKGLTLPPNLIVMGTVNMDETTFSFSRKVLDRAMSIEMNKVNYDDFLKGKTEDDVPVLIDNNLLLVDRPIKSEEIKADIESDKVMEYLKAVNTILEGTPFKLGYRAANEALLYVAAAKVFNNDNLASALDDFTLMKILSRIEGDDTKLKVADRERQVEPELGDDLFPHLRTLFTKTFADLTECKSLIKLKNMTTILERDHFVSFWG